MRARTGVVLALGMLLLLGVSGAWGDPAPRRPGDVQQNQQIQRPQQIPHERGHRRARVATTERRGLPLAGRLIVIDPGHQLGNHNFPDQINRLVPAGGMRKPCNTTGTATDAGFPEATFTWRVAKLVRTKLRRLGASVRMTRHSNSERAWGPCVDVRGRAGNKQNADLKLSIHADGSYASGAHGFHVICPPDRRPWTHDVFKPSCRFARQLRTALTHRGFVAATYTAGGDGLDVRSDLGTLNLSDVPVAMVELGNMRDAGEAATMTARAGQRRYAKALVAGIRAHLR